MLKNNKKFFVYFMGLFLGLILTGCARDKNPVNPLDPYEHFNRRTYAFNHEIDRVFIRPIARTYDVILPWQVKKGVSNFFSNINEISTFANDILQLDLHESVDDLSRFLINSTIGIGGLFDVASLMGLEKNYEDLGLTFAKWGAKNSPYIVLPFLGPSTVRDAIALPINYYALSPWPYVEPAELQFGGLALKMIDLRAKLLPGDKVVADSFDPYAFVRDAYLQRRAYLMDANSAVNKDTFVESDNQQTNHRHHKMSESTIVNN